MKVALVTGGSRGIGAETVKYFARNGYTVILNYHRSMQEANDLKRQMEQEGCGVHLYKANVADPVQVMAMFYFVKHYFKRLDVLVNNAGISLIKQIQDISYEEYGRVMSVNMGGAFLCSREAAKGMIDKQSGLIVNISSVWGEVGGSCESVYSASKAALLGFTKALAKELGWSGVRVNSVSPGVIDTPMNAHFSAEDMQAIKEEIPMGRLGTGEDVARAVEYLYENDYVTGVDIPVNGGFSIV